MTAQNTVHVHIDSTMFTEILTDSNHIVFYNKQYFSNKSFEGLYHSFNDCVVSQENHSLEMQERATGKD